MAIIGVALAQNARTAKEIVVRFDCDELAEKNDLVYLDPANDNKVLVNQNNSVTFQTIGVIKEKPTSTSANVLILGIFNGFSGLASSGKVFLQTNGKAGQTLPTTGYVHALGIAVSETEILFIPNNIRVLRS